ncbi:hypothetical protein MTR67_002281 [Solanum verrucosum]|uniref:Uncharacterized protein n=1 Tax=Solanum verrucosum TaxID=315347 RepID=A0AAF0PQL5_SOLVR|nr:hypothetical protein MTR67_002281 [Solanum verrucosum]
MFLALFGISWSMPFNIRDAYTSWSSMEVRKSIRKIWIMTPDCIFWVIWNERNRRYFDGVLTPNCKLKASCLVNLFSWANFSPVNNLDHYLDFVSSLAR